MRIEHIAICTGNLEQMKKFYQDYFTADGGVDYFNPKTGLKTCFLRFSGEARLELMDDPRRSREKMHGGCGYTHFAFDAGTKQAVDSLTRRLSEAGVKILKDPRVTGDGYYESCVEDPDGNEIEITAS